MDIPPVVRGEFLYREVLLVDVGGELKRHPRASEAEIKRLLNATDSSGKDQVSHWYEAQLIHYGLQRSKVKNTAKMRLHQAINSGKLKAQPAHLVDMEGQMKKEFTAAVRKSKIQTKSPAPPMKGAKRAREEESEQNSKKTKISLKVGDVSINIEDITASTTTKQKATKSVAAKSSAPRKPKESSLSGASKASAPAKWLGSPKAHPDNLFQGSPSARTIVPAPQKPRKEIVKKEAIKKEPVKKAPVKKEPVKKAPIKKNPVKKESIKKEPVKRKPVKKEPIENDPVPYDENEPISYDEDEPFSYDEDDAIDMDIRPDITKDQLTITGVYNIDCQQLADQAPDHADKFRLFLCVDNEAGKIWGGFDLAWKSGHIKIDDIGFNTELTFGWRARDYEDNGRLTFGRGCYGNIEFDGNGEIHGIFFNLFHEPVYFQGYRRPGPLWCGKSSYTFQTEWNGYPAEAYGR